jgi:prevent-host-death family protein
MPISDFKAACTRVLREVAAAEKVIEVTRHGRVVALVSPPPLSRRRKSFWGSLRGRSMAQGDLISGGSDPFKSGAK